MKVKISIQTWDYEDGWIEEYALSGVITYKQIDELRKILVDNFKLEEED